MRLRKKAISSLIMLALSAINPFSNNGENNQKIERIKRSPRKKVVQNRERFLLPVTKQAFKQNQRKELKSSSRKKSK
jgi:hypothetical protein